jgi:hypothetical protein
LAEPRRDLVGEIALMRVVGKDFTGEQQRGVRQPCRVERVVEPLFGADPAHGQGRAAARMAGLQMLDRNPVFDVRQHAREIHKTPPLRGRDAVEEGMRALHRHRSRRVELHRQVQGHQGRNPGHRQMVGEVERMAMDQVNRPLRQRPFDVEMAVIRRALGLAMPGRRRPGLRQVVEVVPVDARGAADQ